MKILTWNLQRLEKNKNQRILDKLAEFNADIMILTETNCAISFDDSYNLAQTQPLPNHFDGIVYANGENRTTILTKYNITERYKTFDGFTSVCVEIDTPSGPIIFYGTIIGIFGGKGQRFKNDLQKHLADFEKIFTGKEVCIAGDLNVTFSGYTYPSHHARQILKDAFNAHSLINTTGAINDNVDHIILSSALLKGKHIHISTWNLDKALSDHIGVCITIAK